MNIILCGCLALLSIAGCSQTKINNIMNAKNLTCKLTTPELQQRKKTAIAELKQLILEKQETAHGMKYKFDGSDKILDLLVSFIKTERSCCNFFDFILTAGNENSFAWLELSGPDGTKTFLKEEIGL
jgi:hypothetical protein